VTFKIPINQKIKTKREIYSGSVGGGKQNLHRLNSTCRFDNGIERSRVGDCDFAEHFSVEVDIGLTQGADESAVSEASHAACGGYTRDPKTPEVAFLGLAVASGHDSGAERLFHDHTIPA